MLITPFKIEAMLQILFTTAASLWEWSMPPGFPGKGSWGHGREEQGEGGEAPNHRIPQPIESQTSLVYRNRLFTAERRGGGGIAGRAISPRYQFHAFNSPIVENE